MADEKEHPQMSPENEESTGSAEEPNDTPEIIIDADPLLKPSPAPPRPAAPAQPKPAPEAQQQVPPGTEPRPEPKPVAPAEAEPRTPKEEPKPRPKRKSAPAPKPTPSESPKPAQTGETEEESQARRLAERGDVFRQEGQFARAQHAYQEALAFVSDYPAAVAGLARIEEMRDQLRVRLTELVANIRAGKERLEAALSFDLTGLDLNWPEVVEFRKQVQRLAEEHRHARQRRQRRLVALLVALVLVPLLGWVAVTWYGIRSQVAELQAQAATAGERDLESLLQECNEFLESRQDTWWKGGLTEVNVLVESLRERIEARDFDQVQQLAAQSPAAPSEAVLQACEEFLNKYPTSPRSVQVRKIQDDTARQQVEQELRSIIDLPLETREQYEAALRAVSVFRRSHSDTEWQQQAESAAAALSERWFRSQFDAAEQRAEEKAAAGEWIDARLAWGTFLQMGPPEPWASQAKQASDALIGQEAQQVADTLLTALDRGDIPADEARRRCEDYLKRYPDTAPVERIRRRLAELQSETERGAFDALAAKMDATDNLDEKVALVEAYLREHPASPFRAQLQAKIKAARERNDDTDFAKAVEEARRLGLSERSALQSHFNKFYLLRHPEGEHVAEVNEIVQNGFERTQHRLYERIVEVHDRQPVDERLLVQLADDYIALYPNSASASRVAQMRRSVERDAERRLFEVANTTFRNGNLQLALNLAHEYVSKYPEGQYKTEAVRLRDEILAKIEEESWTTLDALYEKRAEDPDAFLDHAASVLARAAGHPRAEEIRRKVAEVSQDAVRYWLDRARQARDQFDWEVVAACAVRALRHNPQVQEAIQLRDDAVRSGRLSPNGAWRTGTLPPRY